MLILLCGLGLTDYKSFSRSRLYARALAMQKQPGFLVGTIHGVKENATQKLDP
jgi:hypothetical protein